MHDRAGKASTATKYSNCCMPKTYADPVPFSAAAPGPPRFIVQVLPNLSVSHNLSWAVAFTQTCRPAARDHDGLRPRSTGLRLPRDPAARSDDQSRCLRHRDRFCPALGARTLTGGAPRLCRSMVGLPRSGSGIRTNCPSSGANTFL